MFPIAVMPVMPGIGVMPSITGVRFVVIPPVFRVEGQTNARKMHPGVGMPAITKAVADNVGGSTVGGADEAANRNGGGQQGLFDNFAVHDFSPSLVAVGPVDAIW
jgi:hypothetical protein